MNISIFLIAGATTIFAPKESTPPSSDSQVINSVILINGTPTVASINSSADVVSIYGTEDNYFESVEDEQIVINRVMHKSPISYGLIVDRSFVIQDTSELDEFSEEQIDALREVVIDYENSLQEAQIILKYADESLDLSLAQSIRSVLIDFGVSQSNISLGQDTIPSLDNYGVQVSLVSKSTARL